MQNVRIVAADLGIPGGVRWADDATADGHTEAHRMPRLQFLVSEPFRLWLRGWIVSMAGNRLVFLL